MNRAGSPRPPVAAEPDPPRPRRRPNRIAVAALCGLLAFALVTQVRSNATVAGVGAARSDDLIGVLTELTARNDRLRQEIAALQATQQQLAGGSGQTQAAVEEARRRAETLGILAGTLPATGPGIELTLEDPRGSLRPEVLVDAIQELRDAGAEAMQLGSVRVVASTYVLGGTGGGVTVDGRPVRPPYRFLVIGDSGTLSAALGIPGGVLDTVARAPGARARVVQSREVAVAALRPLVTPRYARPTAGPPG